LGLPGLHKTLISPFSLDRIRQGLTARQVPGLAGVDRVREGRSRIDPGPTLGAEKVVDIAQEEAVQQAAMHEHDVGNLAAEDLAAPGIVGAGAGPEVLQIEVAIGGEIRLRLLLQASDSAS